MAIGNRILRSLLPALSVPSLALLLSACGGGDPGDASGGSGGAGTGGGSPSGGASGNGGGSTGGDSSGGSSTGGSDAGGHCSPVAQTSRGPNLYPGVIDNCGQPSNWTGEAGVGFRDFDLGAIPEFSPPQIGPGDVYSFSAQMGGSTDSFGRFAIYGATEKCGDVGELLSDVTVRGQDIVCHELRPETGTYTHLIWVWYGGGSHGETSFCLNGTCPAR